MTERHVAPGDLKRLIDAFTTDAEHPEVATTLSAYVDGSLAAEQTRDVAAHLAQCARCREDVDDLRREQEALTPRSSWRLPLAAAAAVALIAAGTALFLMRDVKPPPPPLRPQPAGYGRADWDAAARSEHLPPPSVFAQLRPAPETLRGDSSSIGARLEPGGEVIESAQPRFTWPAEERSRYVVSVFDEGKRLVADSGEIAAASWTVPKPLARGATYSWQVEVRKGDAVLTLPAPPAPPVRFRVLDEPTLQDVEAARRRFPNDHLLLGVLYARAGVQRRAEEELRASHDPRAARLLNEVRHW